MQELSALKLFTISNNGHTAVKLPKQNGVAKYISPCASVARIECCESGAPKGAERSPTGHEAAGRGRVPPGLELEATPRPPSGHLVANR